MVTDVWREAMMRSRIPIRTTGINKLFLLPNVNIFEDMF